MNRPIFAIAAAAALLSCAPALAQSATACAQGKAGVGPTAAITFTAPTTNTDGTPINGPLTYEILQGSSATALSVAAKGLANSPITVNTGLSAGSTVYFAVVAVDAKGNASAQSNVACKTFPASVPSSFTITVTDAGARARALAAAPDA